MRYGIIGAGALGALYGALLQKAGCEVHFLVRGDYAHIKAHGLRIDSHWGDFTLPQVKVYNDVRQMPPCDVLLLTLKTTSNHELAGMLPPMVKPGCIVLSMQNGLGAEEELAALLPQAKIGGGLCYLCSSRVGPGHILHLDYGKVEFGAHSPNMQVELAAVLGDFKKAGVPVELADDLKAARWKKLFWNIPFNGLTVALNASTEQLMACPRTTELARALMGEVLAGARACGCTIIDESYIGWICEFTRKMKPYKPSMKLDFEAKRPLETEYLYRRPIEAARRLGIAMPRVEMLATELEFLDAQNRK